jgi:hypothetical protein
VDLTGEERGGVAAGSVMGPKERGGVGGEERFLQFISRLMVGWKYMGRNRASLLIVSCSCRHYGPNSRPRHWHYVVSC